MDLKAYRSERMAKAIGLIHDAGHRVNTGQQRLEDALSELRPAYALLLPLLYKRRRFGRAVHRAYSKHTIRTIGALR